MLFTEGGTPMLKAIQRTAFERAFTVCVYNYV